MAKKNIISAEIQGPPITEATGEHQIIAILTKKLGGEILINLEEELKEITGFVMQVTPHGNISIRTNK